MPRLTLSLFDHHAVRLLGIVRDLGVTTDESLAAHLRERGEACDRSRIAHWRRGRTPAPLGLLPVLLSHLGRDGARVLLQALAAPHDLRVVLAAEGGAGTHSIVAGIMETTSEVGALARVWQEAMEDGELDDDERARLLEELERLGSTVADLREQVAAPTGPRLAAGR